MSSRASRQHDEDAKREILRCYHPDLCDMQEVGFGTKTRDSKGRMVEETVHPDVHYRGLNDKEYFVFYTPRIPALKSILNGLLKQQKRFDGWGLLTVVEKQPDLMPILEQRREDGEYPTSEEYESLLRSCFGWGYWWFTNFEATLTDPDAIKKCRDFRRRADMCCYLASAMNQFGMYTQDLDIDKLYAVTMDKDAQIAFLRQMPPERYRSVEEQLFKAALSPENDIDEIREINRLLDNFMREIRPKASIERQVDYCFALKRANFYLSHLEHNLQNKDLSTLVELDKLRRKINLQLLEYRFINEKNTTPFSDIQVDHCKVIVHTEKHTMTFFERVEAMRFKASLEKALDRKSQNITVKYSLDPIAAPELRRLAESCNPKTNDDLLEAMDREIQATKTKIEMQKIDAKANILRLGFQLTELVGKIIITNISAEGGGTKEMNNNEVEEFVKLFDASKKKGGEMDLKTMLAKTLKSISIGPDCIDTLADTFRTFVECRQMEAEVQAMQKRRDILAEKRDYHVDFINMVKLHIQVEREELDTISGYEGVLIEEKRKSEGNELYAEYSVRVI